MESIYNNLNFQELHCSTGSFIKNKIDHLIHCSKLIDSPIRGLYYLETPWGYSFPTINAKKNFSELWKDWSHYCFRQNIIAEIIKIPPFFPIENLDISIFQELHIVSKTCALKIKGKDFVQFFKKKTRYIIKKADKILTCRKANKQDSNEIYQLYKRSMQNLNADKRFLLDLKTFDFLMQDENITTHLAYFEGKLIGFVCIMFDLDISHYHLSATNDIGRKLNANYLLLNNAINESVQRGINLIHLGGGLTNKDDDPLFRFKSKFANLLFDYRIGLSIHNEKLFTKYRNTQSNKIIDFKDI
tara:strand:+ start:22862 stop:23764 length:903 start_codon:yes stop_codon:yes gene_type:complete